MYLKENGDRLLWTGSYLEQISTFRAGVDEIIFYSGPVEAERRHFFPVSTGLLFWNLMAHLLRCEDGSTSPPRWL